MKPKISLITLGVKNVAAKGSGFPGFTLAHNEPSRKAVAAAPRPAKPWWQQP